MTLFTPTRAADLRWGVCAHLGNRDYDAYTPEQLVEMVQHVGATTVRSNHSPSDQGAVAQALALRAAGIKLHAPLPAPDNWREEGALTRAATSYLTRADTAGILPDSVEFPNEFNGKPSGWDLVVRREIAGVAAACTAAGVAFYGPSLIAFKAKEDAPLIATDLAGQPLATHYGTLAVHSYVSDAVPETAHEDRLATLRRYLCGDDTRVVMTETGWHDAEGERGYVLPEVQATYAPRLILSQVGVTMDELDWYQLADTPGDRRSEHERRRGLFGVVGVAKPIADSLHGLAEILNDTGARRASFTPRPLDVTVTGPTGLQWRLIQKTSGNYSLAIWTDRPAARLADPAEEVRVVTGRPMTGRWLTDLGDIKRGRKTRVQQEWTVPVTGEVSVLRLAAA